MLFLRSFRDVATGTAAGTAAMAVGTDVSSEVNRVRTGDVKSKPSRD